MKKFILHQPWGGLGDNLQYSTLPELCYNNNIDFYLHESNVYRNPDIYDLVWKSNPFVRGISNDVINAGSSLYNDITYVGSAVTTSETVHGFDAINEYPIIYYYPKYDENYSDKKIVDFTGISSFNKSTYSYNKSTFKSFVTKYFDNDNYIFIEKDNIGITPFYELNVAKVEKIKDIYQLCDIIYSAKEFNCIYSGASVLASAINRFKSYNTTTCWLPENTTPKFDIGIYFFNNINYKGLIC